MDTVMGFMPKLDTLKSKAGLTGLGLIAMAIFGVVTGEQMNPEISNQSLGMAGLLVFVGRDTATKILAVLQSLKQG